jgi:hypothetical protein
MQLARCGGLTVTISISVHPSFSKVMFAPDISTMEHRTLLGCCCPYLMLLFGRTVPLTILVRLQSSYSHLQILLSSNELQGLYARVRASVKDTLSSFSSGE